MLLWGREEQSNRWAGIVKSRAHHSPLYRLRRLERRCTGPAAAQGAVCKHRQACVRKAGKGWAGRSASNRGPVLRSCPLVVMLTELQPAARRCCVDSTKLTGPAAAVTTPTSWQAASLLVLHLTLGAALAALLSVLHVTGPQREVVAQQLHDEGAVLVALLSQCVQLSNRLVKRLLGQVAGALW